METEGSLPYSQQPATCPDIQYYKAYPFTAKGIPNFCLYPFVCQNGKFWWDKTSFSWKKKNMKSIFKIMRSKTGIFNAPSLRKSFNPRPVLVEWKICTNLPQQNFAARGLLAKLLHAIYQYSLLLVAFFVVTTNTIGIWAELRRIF